MAGTLYVVATPIGNLEDITLRALRVLREVTVIAAEDTRRTAHLLARHAIATPTTSLHEHNEVKKTPSLIARLLAGDDIALVSDAGTPTISDPGRHLIRSARDAGVRVEPIPGPSAVMAALSASGIEADQFQFLGFPPNRSKDRDEWFARIRDSIIPVVFFEAPHRIERTLDELKAVIGDAPVFVARELTKVHEQLVNGPISAVARELGAGRGEFVVVVELANRPNTPLSERPSDRRIVNEFGQLIDIAGMTPRRAAASVARKYGLPTNEVYRLVEASRSSVE